MSERTVIFLVRGVCVCGWEAALPEGARWPVCPQCGEQVLPPRPPMPDGTAGPADDRHLVGDTLPPREGYVAVRMPEQEALAVVMAIVQRGILLDDQRRRTHRVVP